MIKRKCKVCFKGYINKNGACEICGANDVVAEYKAPLKSFYGACEACGGEGRLIEHGEGRNKVSYYQCYECNAKEFERERRSRMQDISEKNKNLGNPKFGWTKAETMWQFAIIEHYLKPLFYKRQPNNARLAEISLELLKEQVKDGNMIDILSKMQKKAEEKMIFEF